jgi:hypothetical protein
MEAAMTTITNHLNDMRTSNRGARSDSNVGDLRSIIAEPGRTRPQRLLRLQGWRGAELAAATRAGAAHRLAPATCATLALVVAVTGSLPVAVFTLMTAVVGVFAANHPVETAFNRFARHTGRNQVPANRAAKRLGCLIGTLFFAAGSAAIVVGHIVAGRVIVGAMATVATLVAVTNVCVPSILFTLVWGSNRATARTLAAAVHMPTRTEAPAPLRSATWVPVEGYNGCGEQWNRIQR